MENEKNIFDVLNIPNNSTKEDVMEAALSLYESATVISVCDWNTIAFGLSALDVTWAPKPIERLSTCNTYKSLDIIETPKTRKIGSYIASMQRACRKK